MERIDHVTISATRRRHNVGVALAMWLLVTMALVVDDIVWLWTWMRGA